MSLFSNVFIWVPLLMFVSVVVIDKIITHYNKYGHWKRKMPEVGKAYVLLSHSYKKNEHNPFEKYSSIEFSVVKEIQDDWILFDKYERGFGQFKWSSSEESQPLNWFREKHTVPCDLASIKITQILNSRVEND